MLHSVVYGGVAGRNSLVKRDYLTTFLAEALVIASYLLTFRVIAQRFSQDGFGEYALSRRAISLVAPIAVLALDVAIARCVAYAIETGKGIDRSYVTAGLALGAIGALVVSVLLLAFAPLAAGVLFGSAGYAQLVQSFPLILAGLVLHGISYGNLRGRFAVQRANVLLILNQAVVPLAAVIFSPHSVARILLLMGLGWVAISAAFLPYNRLGVAGIVERATELARYGIPRVPGELLQLALFALPGILVAHTAGIAAAGIVAFGVATIRMAGSALTPISFVLLPHASRLLARGEAGELRRHVVTISRITVVVLLGGILMVEVFAEPILRVYLGPQFVTGAPILRLITTAVLPWGLYVTLKSVIDARHFEAINARNAVVAFVVFVGLAFALSLPVPGVIGPLLAFCVSLYLLGALTVVQAYRAGVPDPAL